MKTFRSRSLVFHSAQGQEESRRWRQVGACSGHTGRLGRALTRHQQPQHGPPSPFPVPSCLWTNGQVGHRGWVGPGIPPGKWGVRDKAKGAPKETTPTSEGLERAGESVGKREVISFGSPQSGLSAQHAWLLTEHSFCPCLKMVTAPFHARVTGKEQRRDDGGKE